MRPRNILLAGVVVEAFILGGLSRRANEEVTTSARDAIGRQRPETMSELDESFSYDVAARFNGGIVANIDAVDTAVTTILAGDVAVLVLTIDKIKELAHTQAVWAIALLSASALACVIAYVLGLSIRANRRDGLRPRVVIPDLIEQPKEALIAAVIGLVSAGERNLTMRFVKKSLGVLAILLLLSGAVVIAVARASGNLVH